jgi:hypothetical protein
MKCQVQVWIIMIFAILSMIGAVTVGGLGMVNLINIIIFVAAIIMMVNASEKKYVNAATAGRWIMWTAVVTLVINSVVLILVSTMVPVPVTNDLAKIIYMYLISFLIVTIIIQGMFIALARSTVVCFTKAARGLDQ